MRGSASLGAEGLGLGAAPIPSGTFVVQGPKWVRGTAPSALSAAATAQRGLFV